MFWKTLRDLLKKYLIAGMLVMIPLAGTIWILKAIILWADGFFVLLLPEALRPSFLTTHRIPGVGLVLTIAVMLLTGVLTRLYLGKKAIAMGDRLISKIPFGSSIYGAIKQILNSAFKQERFKGVALVEYPKDGSYALAFITGISKPATSPDPSKKYLNLFVPTTPNPTSGFMLILPEEKVRPLNISVEEASRIIISGGLLS